MTRPSQTIRVAVLMGGPDAEREVSLASGERILAALEDNSRFDAVGCVVDRPSVGELAAFSADVIFPALHGPYGEGGVLQQTLEMAGIPFVGSDSKTSALAMDKCATKHALLDANIPTPRWGELVPGDDCPLEPPVVIKPTAEGSSVGVYLCFTTDEVAAARRQLEERYSNIMAEAFVDGREVTVGIVEGVLLPLIEIRAATRFYDYDAKYHRSDTEYIFDPDLGPGVEESCHEQARATWSRLGCRDIARIDFMLDNEGVWVLEVNTMPGFTDHSLVPMAARRIGMEMPDLCGRLVMAAHGRGNDGRVGVDEMARA